MKIINIIVTVEIPDDDKDEGQEALVNTIYDQVTRNLTPAHGYNVLDVHKEGGASAMGHH